MNDEIRIFDRSLKRLHKQRSALSSGNNDFLIKEASDIIFERLDEDINPKFSTALNLGHKIGTLPDKSGIKTLIQCDVSADTHSKNKNLLVAGDEELLPFAEESFDLITSVLSMHWVNDLPGCLIQIRRCLKKNGLFIGTMFGINTLHEMREAIKQAEIEISGGISPRISPFTDVKNAGALLQRAGFHLPVADSNKITAIYKDAFSLMRDLRAMGETNALVKRKKSFTSKKTMELIAEKYKKLFQNEDGNIPATFEIITLTGWKN